MITARGLARSYTTRRGVVRAVRGVDLDVAAGEIVALLGPNGAGKTTTLRMLTTLLRPSAGTARVAGCDLVADPNGVRRRIGYVAQHGGAAPDCRVLEDLVLQGRIHGLSKAESKRRAERLAAELDLNGLGGRVSRTLSGGQRRRLDLALGLIHEPRLVFLDEPTTSLDPQSRANLWQHIRRLREERGITVVVTTHYLDEADSLADRVLVVDRGRVVASGSPDELKRALGGDALLLDVERVEDAVRCLEALPGVGEVHIGPDGVRCRVRDGGTALPTVLRALDAASVPLRSVQMRRPTLDDVFLDLTGRALREAGEATPAGEEVDSVA
ncbi:ATP-binding cassette domain-containing protein [Saccharothrix longispora]|uniref:ABC-2 type transport system ATP-binding protein n=1 Tax=Saccharothrix longispora TaxID=33920 RepID=A0ABU1PR80_9PSEU|nr:ATP-binding cassette domain-containing protein [Saccharothrix longispora]MDR6593145.1 ABC-2 type transport system ATP-binding protein [Saccharothrix longispora]